MRTVLLGTLLVVTAACGGYEFPGQAPSPSPQAGAVAGHVISVPCGPVEPAANSCAGRPVPNLEIDYIDTAGAAGVACAPCKAVTDAQGIYSTELPPGAYTVKLKTYMRVISGPLQLKIAPGGTTTANYVLDSGIRAPTA